MKRKRRRDTSALNSRLIRRPIQRMAWLFLLPTFAAFCVGFLYPFLKGAFLSLCSFKITSDWKFVGFDNYVKAFQDASFMHAFWYTALFALVSLISINLLAFVVAYALTRGDVEELVHVRSGAYGLAADRVVLEHHVQQTELL